MQPEAVAAGLIAAAYRRIDCQVAACFGLLNRRQHRRRIARYHRAVAGSAHAVAQRQLPVLLAQLEGHVQPADDWHILPMKGRVRRIHLCAPFEKRVCESSFYSKGLTATPFHSI
ncbi:hypothetical protein BGV49_26275 [Burkholderia ubonensis]|nr:hypothetical protein BGV49_26275 [Burkholderia ubonensis]